MRNKEFLGKWIIADPFKIRKMAAFSKITNIPLRLMNNSGKELWRSPNFNLKGRFCEYVNRYYKTSFCRFSHQKGVKETIRWGFPYIGNCCLFVFQISVPIMNSKKIAGYLLASPFLMNNPSELTREELSLFLQSPLLSKKSYGILNTVQVAKEKEVNEAANLLFSLAKEFSFPNLNYLEKVREIQNLQGQIVEELQILKTINPDEAPSKIIKISHDIEKELIKKILDGEREKAKEILYRLLALLLSQHLSNIHLLKISIIELFIIICRAAVEAGANSEDILEFKYQFIPELWNINNQEELCFRVVKMVENIVQNTSPSTFKKQIDPRLKRALEFVENSFCSKISLKEIAQEAFLSPSRFSHLIKNELGFTITNYLTKLRIEKARKLLEDLNLSIKQIAQEIGYSDQSYFTKVFKKNEGTTPASFRKNLNQ